MAAAPALSSISPSLGMISPGTMVWLLADRLVHGDELGAVGKGCLDLHLVDHLGDTVHYLRPREDMGGILHEIGHQCAVARALDHEVGDERDRLRMVELDPALQPPPRHV